MLPPAIHLRNVGVVRSNRWILRGINWEVPAGSCAAAVLGPNRSGKSTPSPKSSPGISGRPPGMCACLASISGKSICTSFGAACGWSEFHRAGGTGPRSHRARSGDDRLFRHPRTLRRSLAAHARGCRRDARSRRAASCGRSSLHDAFQRRADALPAGAWALVVRPRLLDALDEPTMGLDFPQRASRSRRPCKASRPLPKTQRPQRC